MGLAPCDTGRIARAHLHATVALVCGLPLTVLTLAGCSSSEGGRAGVGGGASARAGTSNAGAADGGIGAAGGTLAGQGGNGTGAGGSNAASGGVGGRGTGGAAGMGGSGGMPSGSAGAGGSGASAGAGEAGGASGTGDGGRMSLGGAGAGSAGAAGSANSTDVCGTAAEDASATLSCPDGQIIDAVVFASYGTPSGTCGGFAVGDCNAATSTAMVTSLCAGRRTCSVTASNGTFGDPCRSTTKSLSIEVSCVVGEPTPVEERPYKGVANSPAAELSELGATWCYNWGATPQSTDCSDPLFVPMIWGSGDVGKLSSIASAGYDTVLAFNEPNKSDQSNMTVAAAIALWPELTESPDIRVSSPAVSDDGRAWLEDFMDQAQAQGLRVDFIAMHWYGWNEGSCTAGQLEGAVNWASQWGLPVWITEFGCMGSSNPDEKTLLDFFDAAIPMLAKHPLVERYAWYPWNTYNHLYDDASGDITALGMAFQAAPATRQ